MEIKNNFFSSAKPAVTLAEVVFTNDPKFRAAYGQWAYDNFDTLVAEYKTHGRFLTPIEILALED